MINAIQKKLVDGYRESVSNLIEALASGERFLCQKGLEADAKVGKRYSSMSDEDLAGKLWVVLEGDWGGQIYLTVPVKLIGADSHLEDLLAELDRQAWGCNNGDGQGIRVSTAEETEDGAVGGGMGGGLILPNEIWTHEEFNSPHWLQRIKQLLNITN